MRPAGEVRQALLQACAALARPDQGATLRELAARACVGLKAAERTVDHMRRAGQVHIVRTRRVPYRNRPVAEYAPAAPLVPAQAPAQVLACALTAWVG